ncbi:MAG TPA: S-layer protein [Methanoregulaceae archaeon]|nr:S-layer protein [Methanoregulaceae archaeon]MDD5048924.1 S-layer protein [Methanoregulaceae archaeon]MDD5685870.1 S-layer protein [Methanoregulaceae archaeon]HOP66476.1 S-layer protein [Methanoregulaceae archaeon]HPJ73600.1 S-layer protein [Methanoregulaceae archaeon]
MKGFIPILVICSVFLIICSAAPASAQVYSVVVDSYSVNPPVLMPEELGTVTVTIRGAGSGSETSTVSYPESGYTASSATTRVIIPYVESVVLADRDIRVKGGNGQFEGYIGPEQVIPLTFLIEAPAKSGLYFPQLLIRIRGGQSVKYPVPVNVNTQLAVMRSPSIELGKHFPMMVKPGTTVDGSIEVYNGGQVRADNLHISLVTAGLPATPAGSSTFLVDYLEPGESRTINLSFHIDKNAAGGLTEVPLIVSYSLLDGSPAVHDESVALDIRGEAELGITAIESSPVRVMEGDPFDLIIRIENTGTGEAKSVSADIDLPFTGTGEAFIGKIRAGNDAPAVFSLTATDPGEHTYTLTARYTDDYGEHTLTRTLNLYIEPRDNSAAMLTGFVLLLVACGAGYYWYSRRKKE